MKKMIYFLLITCLPAIAFSQTSFDKNEPTSQRVVQISPNPGNGQFNVLFAKYHDIYTSMIAYDNTGKVVYEKQHLNGNPVYVDMSHLQSGVYFVVFMANNRMEHITERVILAK